MQSRQNGQAAERALAQPRLDVVLVVFQASLLIARRLELTDSATELTAAIEELHDHLAVEQPCPLRRRGGDRPCRHQWRGHEGDEQRDDGSSGDAPRLWHVQKGSK
jgi:hypothetical protein